MEPEQALEVLMEGNRRWVAGEPCHPHQSAERRIALREDQQPFATVFSCIDARVAPEIVFDRGLGDLAVVRTGAHVLDEVVFGSLEFAPGQLGAPLILVMGHQRCGAVLAAIRVIESGSTAPGRIQAIVDALRPAYEVAIGEPGDLVENTVRAQTSITVEQIKLDPAIGEFIARGELLVRGGYYSLDSGEVSLIA